MLRERFPQAFRVPRLPLAIGIFEQIHALAGSDIDPQTLHHFLRFWTTRPDYLDAVAHLEPRINLDGTTAGVPDPRAPAERRRLRLWPPRRGGARQERPMRTLTCLHLHWPPIVTIGQLVALSAELLRVPTLGRKTLDEIKQLFRALGVEWA